MIARFRIVLAGMVTAVLISPNLALACEAADPCKSRGNSGYVIAIAGAVLVAARLAWLRWTDLPPIPLDPEDPEVIRAKQAARDSVAQFWSAFEEQKPGTDFFALKVALPAGTDGYHESVWIGELSRRSTGTFGRILNFPLGEDYEAGQVIALDGLLIDDWTYMDGNEAQGHFIIRVMIDRAPRRIARRIMKEMCWSAADLAAPPAFAARPAST